MRSIIRSLIPDPCVSWIKEMTGSPDMRNSLQRLKSKGFEPRAAIDVGAFEGQWSKTLRSTYPNTELLLIEPLPEKALALEKLTGQIRAKVENVLCSDETGTKVKFFVGSCGSSMYMPRRFKADYIELTTTRLDDLVDRTIFKNPDLLKLDVQGAEDKVIKGAEEIFSTVQVVIIELSIVNSYSQGMLFHEMITFLKERGLMLYDIAGLLRANRTRSINEVDGVFVRDGSPLWNLCNFLPSGAPGY